AAFSPCRLEDRKALFLGNVEGGAFVGLDIEQASAGLRAPAEPFRIVCLHRVLRRRIECLLLHRQREIRRALKDRELFGDLACFLDHLDAAGAGADHADALAGEVETVLRPVSRVKARTGEALEARQPWDVRLGREAGARDEEPGADPVTVGALDLPLVVFSIEVRSNDAGVETDIA